MRHKQKTLKLLVMMMGYFQAEYFYFILILQQWQHIFYYSTWDSSAAAKVDTLYTMSSSPHLNAQLKYMTENGGQYPILMHEFFIFGPTF